MEDTQEVRARSEEIEAATVPTMPTPMPLRGTTRQEVNELKKNFNDSLELFADKLLQLENEVAELKQRQSNYDGTLSENDILKAVGVILGNDRLAEYLGTRLRDKFKDKVKVNFEIG